MCWLSFRPQTPRRHNVRWPRCAAKGIIRASPGRVPGNVHRKLLVYAQGRGLEPQDKPMVRAIVRQAARDNYRFDEEGWRKMIITRKHLARRHAHITGTRFLAQEGAPLDEKKSGGPHPHRPLYRTHLEERRQAQIAVETLMSRPALTLLTAAVAIFALQALAQYRDRVWARYEHEMQDPVEDPPDALRKGEFALGRLRYRSPLDGRRGRYFRWGIDANKGDRLFIGILGRLTRVDAAPIETIIDAGSDEMYDHPWLIAISAGDWVLAPSEAARFRQYFDRGGFLMVDDFHSDYEWAQFMTGIHQIYPDANAVELADADVPFHTVFDMKDRVRVPGANVVHGSQIERGGTTPHWRAILDSQGRMIVAICFNMDIGDGWEFADDPDYPERYSAEAMRLGVNYAVYAMTH
ncbi:MAG: DUF4159 domain-containing protein [Acidobacteria bacterium]|nr:DUF4159 domain-containing protein [Acidobacteriota bacterium]